MPAGPVVSNNTPLVALWTPRRLDLLRDPYGTVLIPPTVHSEFLATESPLRLVALREASWIETRPLKQPRRALTYAGLDLGEAEVLALAEELDSRLALIDERKARRFARRLGQPIIGTVGILILAKEAGKLDNVAKPLRDLEAAGLHLGASLVGKALRLAGETDDETTV